MKFLLVVIIFAAAVYLLVRFLQDRGLPSGQGPGGKGGPGGLPGRPRRPRPSGPPPVKGPDDDEEFLRDLDRKRRLRKDDPES